MALSNDLASQYAKITIASNKKQAPSESTVYGTVVVLEDKTYVKLDGSDLMTPVQITTTVSDGDRVLVTVKNHTATVTGNLKDPSVSSSVMQNQFEQTIIYADQIVAGEIEAIEGRFDTLEVGYAKIEDLEAEYAKIGNLEADNITIKGELNAINAVIYDLDATYAKITDLEAIDATIKNLDVENLDGKYVKIDWANIGDAEIKNFYAKFGMIDDVVISEGNVTGTLVGVKIHGDLITAGTLQADRLMIKGEDGLYYQLNVNSLGEATASADEKYQNGLDGSIIIAQSITADRINVDDLYAFDATIGGFHITDHSLYSGVKESVENSTPGVYLDNEGQVNFGNMHDFVKFYKTTTADGEETHKLEISASSIKLQVEGESSDVATNETVSGVEENLQETDKRVDGVNGNLDHLRAQIEILNNCIQTLVTDENGNSLMKQNGSGWTFDISGLEQNLGNANQTLNNLINIVNTLSTTSEGLVYAVENLENTSEYVWVTTYEDEPCLALGESDSTNGLFITNTRIIFIKEGGEPTYIDKDGLYAGRLEVGTEFRQKDYVWTVRANGNYGLSWKQVVLSSIQVIYTGASSVKVGTDLSKLNGIIVKGTYSNGRVRTINGYALSGEIALGENTITVTYEDKTGTFNVTGVDDVIVMGNAGTYEVSLSTVNTGGTSYTTVYYADAVTVEDNKVTLSKASNVKIYKKGTANYNAANINKLYGKYVCTNSIDGTIYYIDPNATCEVYNRVTLGITFEIHGFTPAYEVSAVLSDGGDDTPAITLKSITASYSGGKVLVGTSVNSLTGIKVEAIWSDGSKDVITDYTITGSISVVGNNTITVSYGGKTATFIVEGYAESVEVTLNRIEVAWTGGAVPVGTATSALDRSKLIVTAHYSDNSSTVLSTSSYTLSGPATLAKGSNTITVSYSGKTASFTVEAVEETVEVTLVELIANYTGGDKPVGTSINDLKNGLAVRAEYSDDTYTVLSESSYTLSGPATLAQGANTITVSYGGKTTTFTVNGIAQSTGGLVIKRGTTTSATVDTGLSSIDHFIMNASSLSKAGLIDLGYDKEEGSHNVYCSSYSAYSKTGGFGSAHLLLKIENGIVTWSGTGNEALASGVTYNWFAIGEE